MTAPQRWTLIATILASSMTFIDGTVVNVALPALQSELHATIVDVQWVIEAYALFLGALILVGGALGDQLGRKRVFLAGVAVFTAASVACGAAPSPRALIIARGVQGIGAAFLVPGSLAIISATFGDDERGRAIGIWSGFSAITTAIGPVLGGWLIEHLSWRAAFYVNVPIAAIVLVLSLRWMKESHDPEAQGIDWLGAALAVIGLGGCVLGLLELPARGIANPLVASSLVVGVAALVAFVVAERREKHAMLPPSLFRSRTFTLANVLTLLLYAALALVVFLVPMVLIQVRRHSATFAGAALLPLAILLFVLSGWAGGLVARIGSRIPLTIGPIVAGVGLVLMSVFARAESYWIAMFPGAVVLGLGMSITVAPLTTTAMNAVETHRSGIASGVNNAVARIAGLVAIAVFGVVLSQSFRARVEPKLDQLALPAAARSGIDRELEKMAGADVGGIASLDDNRRRAVRAAIDDSFVSAFRVIMACAAGLAFLAGGAGAAIRDGKRAG